MTLILERSRGRRAKAAQRRFVDGRQHPAFDSDHSKGRYKNTRASLARDEKSPCRRGGTHHACRCWLLTADRTARKFFTGTGDNWVGRVELTDQQSPGELTRFFVDGAVGAGWTLTTSTVARTITLNFERNGRKATILIDGARESTGGGFLGLGGGGSEGRTRVTISVNHEGAVQDQTPFRIALPGAGSPEASLNPALPPTAANTVATESALLGLIAVSGAIGNTTAATIDSGAAATPR